MKIRLQFIIMFLAGVASQAVSIIVSMILVRHMNKEMYGAFSQVNFLVQFTAMILIAGIPGSIMYFYPRLSEDQKKAFFLQTIAILAMVGTIGSLVLHLVSPGLGAKFNNLNLAPVLSFYSYAVGLTMVVSYFPAFLIVTGRVRQAALSTFILQLGQGGSLLYAVFTDGSLITMFIYQVLFLLIYVTFSVIVTLFLLRNQRFKFDAELLLDQIKYFLPITASNSIHYIGKQIDRYFVSSKFSVSTFATFELGAREFPFVSQISENIGTVSKSKLSEFGYNKDYDGLISTWAELMKKSWLMYCPLMILLFFTANEIYVVLYTNSFTEAANLFRVFLLVMLFRTLNIGLIIESVGLTRVIGIASVCFTIVNIVLVYLLLYVANMGLLGPPIATLVSCLVMVVVQAISLRRYCGVNILFVLPYRYAIKVAIVSIVASVVGWLLMRTQDGNIIRIGLFVIGFTPIVLIGYWIAGLLDSEEKAIIRRAIGLST